MSGSGGSGRLRRRWVHRRGVMFEGTLHPPRGPEAADPGAGAEAGAARPVLARFSATFGLPRPLPDWAGLAVRILGGLAPGERDDLDLLLVSSAAEPALWRQMRPSRDVTGCTFSSVTRYDLGGADSVVAAVPREPRSATLDDLAGGPARPIRFRLDAAEQRGAWRCLGELELLARLDGDDPAVRFSPPRGGGGPVAGLRRAVYGWAQA